MFYGAVIMGRKTKNDWFAAGFELLGELGEAGLTIEALISCLGVTKGSFYHHFKNRTAYSVALLDHWEQEMTQGIIDQADEKVTPKERMERLTQLTVDADNPQLEVAIRAWALRDPVVRGFQEKVDKKRMAYCVLLCDGLTKNKAEAKMWGELVFTVFVGAQQTIPALRGKRLAKLYGELQRLYEAAM